jgi:protein-disulfide isomerase
MRSLSLLPLVLAITFAAGGAGAESVAEMSDDDRAAFRAEVRQYLVDNPEVILEALDVLQAREEQAAAQRDVDLVRANMAALTDNPLDWVGGNPDGDLTVVEFMDYRCGYCRRAHAEVNELVRADGDIRYVVKELPILGEASVLSSRFAIAVRQLYGDAAYKTAHDALIALRGDPTPETLAALAAEFGHDMAAIKAAMDGDEVTRVIDETQALASILQVNGTPTFVVGDLMIRGYLPLDDMRRVVAEARGG